MSSEGAPQKTENVEDWQSGMTTTEVAAAPIQQAGQTKHGQRLQKQRQLGPAPIASFEDISDEVRQKVCISPVLYYSISLSIVYTSTTACPMPFLTSPTHNFSPKFQLNISRCSVYSSPFFCLEMRYSFTC